MVVFIILIIIEEEEKLCGWRDLTFKPHYSDSGRSYKSPCGAAAAAKNYPICISTDTIINIIISIIINIIIIINVMIIMITIIIVKNVIIITTTNHIITINNIIPQYHLYIQPAISAISMRKSKILEI